MEEPTECDLLEAWLAPIAELLGESQDDDPEEMQERDDSLEKRRNSYSENDLFQERVGTEIHGNLQQLSDLVCSISGGINSLTPVSSENLHFPQPENRLFSDSWSHWLCLYLENLRSGLFLIQSQAKSREAKISSLSGANKLLNQLLKSKEEMLDSVSEELYKVLMDKSQVMTMECCTETEENDLPIESCTHHSSSFIQKTSLFPMESDEILDDKSENGAGKRRELSTILGMDSIRRSETLRTCLHHWKILSTPLCSGMVFGSFSNSGSLEGNYKLKIRLTNPLNRVIGSDPNPLPSPCLFGRLFSVLDQYHRHINQIPSQSIPDFLTHHLPSKSHLSKDLKSLQIYYTGECDCAVVFARLFQLFDQDPLLSSPCIELVRLNADLKELIEKNASESPTIKDMESGGFLSISETIKFAFSIVFSADSKLIKQFLDAIKPEELSELDWARLVLGLLMKERGLHIPDRNESNSLLRFLTDSFQALIPFLTDSIADLDAGFCGLGEEMVGTGDLLEVSRGEILACLLQVYDLYIDQLYVQVESIGSSDSLSMPDFTRFCKEIDPVISPKAISAVWQDAISLDSRESNSVGKDAALLAIMRSDWPTLASNPLLSIVQKPTFRPGLTVQTESIDGKEEDSVYCATLGSYRGHRNWPLFTPKGRRSVRRQRHTLSASHDNPFPF